MAIKPICDKCKEELDNFGALIFSPPDNDNKVKKLHLCKDCYAEIITSFNQKNKSKTL